MRKTFADFLLEAREILREEGLDISSPNISVDSLSLLMNTANGLYLANRVEELIEVLGEVVGALT